MELFEQHNMDGHAKGVLISSIITDFFIMAKVLEFESDIEFIADINDHKDCLMSQDPTQETPNALWYNIDIPKGHVLKAGDRIRITVEKL